MQRKKAFLCLQMLGTWLVYAFLTPVFAANQNSVQDVRIWQGPESSRMVFDLSHTVNHRIFMLSNPERIVIDLPRTLFEAALDTPLKPPISNIRYGHADNDLTRLVVVLTQQSKVSSFLLEPQQNFGYRLVVDIFPPTQKNTIVSPHNNKPRDILIAVDAGHGGEDFGAIADQVNEKTLVLDYAKTIANEIRTKKGFDAFLVRTGDYFIPLQKRMQLARKKRADMFISVHANSFPSNNKVRGFMLFALSDKGASSTTARWLAESENKSNAVGGINKFLDIDVIDKDLQKIILDLSVTSVLNHSLLAGREVLHQVEKVTKLHKKTIETANFVVLRAPETPALLIELGFLSNPKETKTMMRASHRQKVSKAIANGLEKYFYDYPPYNAHIAQFRASTVSDPTFYHTVQKGETLSQIALDTGVSVAKITALNTLADHQILVGQKLKLREIHQEKKANDTYYLVQPGDTLWEIAKKHNLSIANLRSLNNLSPKHVIQAGQKLQLYRE